VIHLPSLAVSGRGTLSECDAHTGRADIPVRCPGLSGLSVQW